MSWAIVAGVGGAALGGVASGAVSGLMSDGGGGGDFEFGDLQALFPTVTKFDNLGRELFGPSGRAAIEDFLRNPIPVTDLERREARFFRNELPGLVDEATGRIRSDLFPAATELAETGFRTDISPIADAERFRLQTETAPELAARFGGALSGSGFEQALAQAGEDLGMFLGATQAELDEAAANRRTGFLQSGAPLNIFGAPLELETGAAVASGAAGERFRKRQESARGGGRLFSAIPTVLNAATAQGFSQQGFAPQGPGVGDALASALPAIIEAVGRFGNSGGGGGGGNTLNTINIPSSGAGMDFGTGGGTGQQLPATTTGFSEFSFFA